MVAGCIIVVWAIRHWEACWHDPRERVAARFTAPAIYPRARSKKLGSNAESVMRAKRRWFRSRDEWRLSRRRAKWAGG
jgi:hypothetical protein